MASTATVELPSAAEPAAPQEPRRGLPPGPRMSPAMQTLAWALAPTWVMDQCARRLGDAFTLTFAPSGMKLAMFGDPQAVRQVFTAPPEVAPSGAGSSPVAPVLGQSSVLTLTGREHMRQRKLLLPPFHGERMREYEQVMVDATRRDMASWPLGRAMRMQGHTRAITLEVIVRAVFGVEAERMAPLKQAIRELAEPVRVVAVVRALASRPTGALGRALERLDELIYAEIARRRGERDIERRSDIMSLLLLARDEDGTALTDVELRDELVTLLLAGHETTATSVAWALERLVRHPQKLARLMAEVDAAGADGGTGEQYMTAVVNETLRVRPVVGIVVRVLSEELQVGSYLLPKGTRVAPSIYLTNRSAQVYEDPEAFRPERFLEAAGGRAISPFSWIPFGGGIRRCIGASFAQMEMKVMLRTMLSELAPRAPEGRRGRGDEWIRRRAVTLVPAAGASVVWERRA